MRESRLPCPVPSIFRLLYNYGIRDRFVRLLEKISLFAVKVSSICRSRARTRYHSNCKWIPCNVFPPSAIYVRTPRCLFLTLALWYSSENSIIRAFFSQCVLKSARFNRSLFTSREKQKYTNARYCRRNFWRVFFASVLKRDNAWYHIAEM